METAALSDVDVVKVVYLMSASSSLYFITPVCYVRKAVHCSSVDLFIFRISRYFNRRLAIHFRIGSNTELN